MSNPNLWYAVIDGKADGPHEEQTIREWITTGKLNYSDLVFRSGLTRWVNISECKEFERRGTDRIISETVSKFQTPSEDQDKNQGWIALIKHAEVNGKHHYIQSGPYTATQVEDKIKRGELKYDDHIWKTGFKTWTPISAIPEFERRIKEEDKSEEIKPVSIKPLAAPKPAASTSEFTDSKTLDLNPAENKLPAGLPANLDLAKAEVKKSAGTPSSESPHKTQVTKTEGPKTFPKPKWSQSETIRVEFAKPEPAKTAGAALEVQKTESITGGVTPIGVIAAGPAKGPGIAVVKQDLLKVEMLRPQISKSNLVRTELLKSEPTKHEPLKVEPHKPEPLKPGLMKPETAKPLMAKSEPIAKPGVMPNVPLNSKNPLPAAQMGSPLPAKDSSAPPPPENKKGSGTGEHKESEEEIDDEFFDVTSIPEAKHRRQRFVIGFIGALLVMVLSYAGLNAYRDSLRTDFWKKGLRGVAEMGSPNTNRPQGMLPSTKQFPQTRPGQGAQPLPDPFSERGQVPVNPDVENPTRAARTLRIVSLKTATDHPQLAMETDLPGGTALHVEITARPGTILKFPSYKLVRDMIVQPGSMPSMDLASDKLQAGDYTVAVTGGGLSASSPLAVGVHDQSFKKALTDFRKKVARQQKDEKNHLKNGKEFVARSYASLTKTFHSVRSSAGDEAKKKWNALIKSWKKEFEQRAREIKEVGEKNRNKFAYPDQLLQLKATELKLVEVYRSYDRGLKSDRNIASDDTAPNEFKQSYRDLQKSMARMGY